MGRDRKVSCDRWEFSVSGAWWVFVFPFLRKLWSVMNTNSNFRVVIAFRLAQRRPSLYNVLRQRWLWKAQTLLRDYDRACALRCWLKSCKLCSTALQEMVWVCQPGHLKQQPYPKRVRLQSPIFQDESLCESDMKCERRLAFYDGSNTLFIWSCTSFTIRWEQKGDWKNSIRSFSFALQAALVRVLFSWMYIE